MNQEKVSISPILERQLHGTRINLFGAINSDDLSVISKTYSTINSESTADFLEKLKEAYPENKIHLILDRGSYNTSKETLEKANDLYIDIHHLPPYSPNLNPIERLWKVMNEKTRNNVSFESPTHFKKSILGFFENTWDRIKHDIFCRTIDNFQCLNFGILN